MLWWWWGWGCETGRKDGLPLWSQVSTSEAAISDMPIFWVWSMRNQWLWVHFSLSMFRGSRERSRKDLSSWDPLTYWTLELALIVRMAERGERIVTTDGGKMMSKICCWGQHSVEGRKWRWWKGGQMGDVIHEMYWERMSTRL